MIDLKRRKNLKTGLTAQDFYDAASLLGCEIALIKAVDFVESNSSGFLSTGQPKILFEGHYFYKLLRPYGKAEAIAKEYPTLCYQKWTKQFYKGGEKEYQRLEIAISICNKNNIPISVALRSASWGRYQIMGENFEKCGFTTVEDFVNAFFEDERNHLTAFCEFIISVDLKDELVNKEFAKFAAKYNGKNYAVNQYDKKLLQAYNKFKQKADEPATAIQPVAQTDDVDIIPISNNIPQTSVNAPVVKIEPFKDLLNNVDHVKKILMTVGTGFGISGASLSAIGSGWISNIYVQAGLVAVIVIGVAVAAVVSILYVKNVLDIQKINTLNERDINIEHLRIRANPNMHNVELR